MAQRSGWAWGLRIPATSNYLTIPGSYLRTPVLHATAADAQTALREANRMVVPEGDALAVALVTEKYLPGTGHVYPIAETAPLA